MGKVNRRICEDLPNMKISSFKLPIVMARDRHGLHGSLASYFSYVSAVLSFLHYAIVGICQPMF